MRYDSLKLGGKSNKPVGSVQSVKGYACATNEKDITYNKLY